MKAKAIALKYDKKTDTAPKVTAKGSGKTAKKIIEIAQQHDIPIKKDENLVEMLGNIELEKEVPPEMYKAIAEVFSFIYKLTK